MTASQQLKDALYGSQQSTDLIANAYSGFTKKCKSNAGFTDTDKYLGGGYSWDDEAALERLDEARRDNWWGVSLPEYAQKYGYHDVNPSDFYETWEGPAEPQPPEYMEASMACSEQWEALAYAGVGLDQAEMKSK